MLEEIGKTAQDQLLSLVNYLHVEILAMMNPVEDPNSFLLSSLARTAK